MLRRYRPLARSQDANGCRAGARSADSAPAPARPVDPAQPRPARARARACFAAISSTAACPRVAVPTGYSFNLDGTAIYLTMASLFIATGLGQPMS
ncbi:MAG: hypothetical protein B7X32_19975, partial [Microbacterium sp. 13-71-7]